MTRELDQALELPGKSYLFSGFGVICHTVYLFCDRTHPIVYLLNGDFRLCIVGRRCVPKQFKQQEWIPTYALKGLSDHSISEDQGKQENIESDLD